MQPPARGESRVRRAPSADPPAARPPPSRPRRTPSSSRIDLSPSPVSTASLAAATSAPALSASASGPPAPSAHLLHALAAVLSAFSLASAHAAVSAASNPASAPLAAPPLSLAFPSLLLAAVLLLPFARPSPALLRALRARRPLRAVALLATLHVVALLLASAATATLGPVRAVIASAAHPAAARLLHTALASQPRLHAGIPPLHHPVLAAAALALLARDNAGRPLLAPRAARAALAVHTRFNHLRDNLSDSLRNRSARAQASLSAIAQRRRRARAARKRRLRREGGARNSDNYNNDPNNDVQNNINTDNIDNARPSRTTRLKREQDAPLQHPLPPDDDQPQQPQPPKEPRQGQQRLRRQQEAGQGSLSDEQNPQQRSRRLLSIVRPEGPQRDPQLEAALHPPEPAPLPREDADAVPEHPEPQQQGNDPDTAAASQRDDASIAIAPRIADRKLVTDPLAQDAVAPGHDVPPADPVPDDNNVARDAREDAVATPSGLASVLAVVQAVLSGTFARAAGEVGTRVSGPPRHALLVSILSFVLGALALAPVHALWHALGGGGTEDGVGGAAASSAGRMLADPPFAYERLAACVPIAFAALALPAVLAALRRSGRKPALNRSQKLSPALSGLLDGSLLFAVPPYLPAPEYLFLVLACAIVLNHALGVRPELDASALTPATVVAALLLLAVASLDARRARSDRRRERGMSRHRPISGSSGDLSTHLKSGTAAIVGSAWRSLSATAGDCARVLADVGVHARSNRASWQVLNFLVLQSGMAVVELVYASVTHATGLFSISADNFFCSVALAVGLLAIRFSTRPASLEFSYGYSRIESVCGFANGIMLVYVALLVLLEAFERVSQEGSMAIGRAFSVCLFGIVGNALGLYFFPPESRRENHNVQGIYLHICANTLAFFSVAVSTATTAALPEWRTIDLATAAAVAFGVVVSALPLLARSARLLLLMVSVERVPALRTVEDRLSDIGGVARVAGLRVWNLTPNRIVASVRLETRGAADDELHDEVLAKARAAFAAMGVPASQCTIQISPEGLLPLRAECAQLARQPQRRHRSGSLVDATVDLESSAAT